MADIEKKPLDSERASHDEDVNNGTAHEAPPPPVELSELEVKKLYRKIDYRCVAAAVYPVRFAHPLAAVQGHADSEPDVSALLHGPRCVSSLPRQTSLFSS